MLANTENLGTIEKSDKHSAAVLRFLLVNIKKSSEGSVDMQLFLKISIK